MSPGKRSRAAAVPDPAKLVTAAEIRLELGRILASDLFVNSERLQKFLRYTVELTLASRSEELKEYALGRDVFERGGDYDPRNDSIVRVEAQRLRRKLRLYYETTGKQDPVIITYRTGGYAPTFAWSEAAEQVKAKSDSPASQPGPKPSPNPQVVAVLPFTDLGPDSEADYLCEGIPEQIIHSLISISELRVLGRNTVFGAVRKGAGWHEALEQLGAGTLVEGSVQKTGDRIRVNARVVDNRDGHALWSGSFDRPENEILTLQDEIADATANALHVRFGAGQSGLRAHQDGRNMEAYILYLKARHTLNRMTRQACQQAIEQFTQAVSLYPEYAPSYAGLAEAFMWSVYYELGPALEGIARSKRAALEGLQIDPQLAEAMVPLGPATLALDFDGPRAEAILRQAIALKPGHALAHSAYGWVLSMRGRYHEAVVEYERAHDLDPLAARTKRGLGYVHYFGRNYEKSEQWFLTAWEMDPSLPGPLRGLAQVYLATGRPALALECAMRIREEHALGSEIAIRATALARLGRTREAREAIAHVRELSPRRYIDPMVFATAGLALGDRAQCLSQLEAALRQRSYHTFELYVDPFWDEVRSDPAFQSLMASLGIPQQLTAAE